MRNSLGGLDDIDHEAMREGFAISRLRKYSTERKKGADKKNRKRSKMKKEKELDILKLLNIVQGK